MANLNGRLAKLEAAVPGRLRVVACGPDETEETALERAGINRADLRPTDTLVIVQTGVPRGR